MSCSASSSFIVRRSKLNPLKSGDVVVLAADGGVAEVGLDAAADIERGQVVLASAAGEPLAACTTGQSATSPRRTSG